MNQEMNDYKLKKYKRKKKIKERRRVVVFLMLMLIYFGYHYISLEFKHQKLVKEREKLTIELKEVREKHESLIRNVEEANTDKYIETMARKYLGLVYPNEKIYIERNTENSDSKE